jgi:hypothetical protein
MVAGTLGAGKEWRSVVTKRWCSCEKNSVLFILPFADFLFSRVSLYGLRFTLRGNTVQD